MRIDSVLKREKGTGLLGEKTLKWIECDGGPHLGADINKRGGTFDGGAINSAASEGYIEVVKYLLSSGADLDFSEPARNPLFGAIMSGNIDIVKVLINYGIDTKKKYTGENMTNMDAYAFAIERGQKDIAELLNVRIV